MWAPAVRQPFAYFSKRTNAIADKSSLDRRTACMRTNAIADKSSLDRLTACMYLHSAMGLARALHTTRPPNSGQDTGATRIKSYPTPYEMYLDMHRLTEGRPKVRNFVGRIESMTDRTIATDLFPHEALSFYTDLNLGREVNPDLFDKYYDPTRGGRQGDYTEGISKKIDNIVDSLRKFPSSKRAILTIPFSYYPSTDVDHANDEEAKCLREIHFYLEPCPSTICTPGPAGQAGQDSPGESRATAPPPPPSEASEGGAGGEPGLPPFLNRPCLCATGFYRAQAVDLFPKNIHYIGEIMDIVATGLDTATGALSKVEARRQEELTAVASQDQGTPPARKKQKQEEEEEDDPGDQLQSEQVQAADEEEDEEFESQSRKRKKVSKGKDEEESGEERKNSGKRPAPPKKKQKVVLVGVQRSSCKEGKQPETSDEEDDEEEDEEEDYVPPGKKERTAVAKEGNFLFSRRLRITT
eukprot:g50422.t1